MALQLPAALKPVYDFVFQVVTGALIFSVVFLVAVGLAVLVKFIESLNVAPAWLIAGGHWLEWGLFWVDAFCFALFLFAEAVKLARGIFLELLRGWTRE